MQMSSICIMYVTKKTYFSASILIFEAQTIDVSSNFRTFARWFMFKDYNILTNFYSDAITDQL